MLRPGTLKRYLSFMSMKGCTADEILNNTGITAERLADEHYLVEVASMCQVIENIIQRCGDCGVGFDIGLTREFSDFGVSGYASLSGKNQLENIQEYWNRYGETCGIITKLSLSKDNFGGIKVAIEPAAITEPVVRFLAEEVLAIFFKVGADMNGKPPVPTKLELSYPAPIYAERYAAMFDCPIEFNAPQTSVTYRGDWFEEALKTFDMEISRLLASRLEQLHSLVTASTPSSIALHEFFARKRGKIPTLTDAAADLNTSPRTLSRQLKLESTSYRKEFERFQIEWAIELIKLNKKAIKQISDEVGFSDADAFRRAFKKRTGLTILDFRKTIGVV